jgi:hypothetical protein
LHFRKWQLFTSSRKLKKIIFVSNYTIYFQLFTSSRKLKKIIFVSNHIIYFLHSGLSPFSHCTTIFSFFVSLLPNLSYLLFYLISISLPISFPFSFLFPFLSPFLSPSFPLSYLLSYIPSFPFPISFPIIFIFCMKRRFYALYIMPPPLPVHLSLIYGLLQSWNSRTAFLVEVSGHKLESSKTQLFYSMLFMNRLEFSCFGDFFVRIFKTRVEYSFLKIHQWKGL